MIIKNPDLIKDQGWVWFVVLKNNTALLKSQSCSGSNSFNFIQSERFVENNSFNCYLSNAKSYGQLMDYNNESEDSVLTKRKLVVEINTLKKSLSDLQIEKEDLNMQLLQQFKELKRTQKNLNKDFHKGLEEMMFILSRKVRLPLTNILGLANLLTNVDNSNDENLAYIELLKASAKDLDNITKELGSFIYELNHKKETTSK